MSEQMKTKISIKFGQPGLLARSQKLTPSSLVSFQAARLSILRREK
jgi:hypothetical protein